jgi:Galactosyltransferase.
MMSILFLLFSFLLKWTADASLEIPRTGSLQNCTNPVADAGNYPQRNNEDSGFIVVSCEVIQYRISQRALDSRASQPIVIGVLSGASLSERRNYIRSTWAYKKDNVFFIVGGDWDDIAYEYNIYKDILWIDKEEAYVTETSVLTFKTESFLSILYNYLMKNNSQVEYLVKTDDDSYVNMEELEKALLQDDEKNEPIDYWGKCHKEAWKPHRNHEIPWQKKWYISFETYPEPEYPPYCQGAGIALSRRFLECAVGQRHVENIRYMPNEDVAVGMLAERCGIPSVNDNRVWIRWDENKEITMDGKIIQHYIQTEEHMRLHHKSVTGVMGPKLFF